MVEFQFESGLTFWQVWVLVLNLNSPGLKILEMKPKIKILRPLRRLIWALIVAFMVGVHNFYKQEMDSPDSIVSSIQLDEEQDDSAPKD